MSFSRAGKVVCLSGNIDFDSVMIFAREGQQAILQQQETEFDFSAVKRANSAVLALLLAWHRYAKQQQRVIKFTHLPESVLSLIKISRLNLKDFEC